MFSNLLNVNTSLILSTLDTSTVLCLQCMETSFDKSIYWFNLQFILN